MISKTTKTSIFTAVFATLMSAITPVTSTAQGAESTSALAIEEIVVTARKREESLKDVPVSISVVTSDFLSEAGIRDQYDLFQLVPGINYGEERDRNGARLRYRF